MATILITGGTGLIGQALSNALLAKGYEIIILTRKPKIATGKTAKLFYAEWNINEQTIDIDAITKSDYIIHLAGASISEKRWTAKRKKEIAESRVMSSALLIKALKENPNNVKAVISASAIGWYGPDLPSPQGEGQGVRLETDPPANDFLGQTCKLWEESIQPVTELGKRLVTLRIGIVLSKEGGALKEFLKPLRFGIATILGNGNQIISWIFIDDLVQMIIGALENEKLNGIYNAVGPLPVSNKEMMLALAKSVNDNFFISVPVPAFVLKWIMGEMSAEVLKSTKVSCKKIMGTGFIFQYPTIEAAFQ